jgi:hypothetical protein
MLGSDALFNVTTQVCQGAASGQCGYIGGGSEYGEAAMISGVTGGVVPPPQGIAPMSRMFGPALCTLPLADQQTAEGIVIGLDAVTILGAVSTAGTTACNGPAEVDCSGQTGGVAFNVTVQTV